jgi:3-oxoacyl-[acyl-carrier protein] reductase
VELRDQVAVITGGAGRIGRATARRFLAEGARVVLADVAGDALRAAAATLGAGSSVVPVPADVTREAEVARLMERAVAAFGRLDVLVTAAAVKAGHSWPDVGLADWEAHLATNLTGCFLCCRAATPHMRERGSGRIVNVASCAGRYRSAYFPHGGATRAGAPYAASQGGVLALTRELAMELGPHGILVNTVVPGWIVSDKEDAADAAWRALPEPARRAILAEISLGRPGRPEEVAAVVLFLASPACAYMTAAAVDVNGGWWMS